ncbi:hypothetical protein JZM24_17265 [Candidatus Sodalis endolongispinus]|uniref:Phage protein n=1 Tax=Candidatus Sodalis endolongispinus TaxID=2812662 RepID=A0ABS5YEF5_9GAMM|nr:hypothetical protein [Candidatus Sodalis endolongispinus]MBT9433411.1 hypothetical protein [Candidatus Sodalis endolongispinus]
MNSEFNENTDNNRHVMTKRCYTHKIKVAENTLEGAYNAVNIISHLKSSIKKGDLSP